ncbi:transmembrane protein, putative (macronuclear) [Tetrahymena thermophila SB210]|uniref:Transmembrane protein, putative n=1 Tax=Tetrahymena thermophila (strain SB210) TaxID=312017 RepID=Q23JT6_TETTS|nr:transmembrane protein, putative [Tetrahymena thermophila SB210]EAR96774.2 transmembrane protein, putative [Tetrahymena thermophila SB210]|eukprot:XP_001017019.2 transmembrane protein, putative [Tetrahymena thermophila SB210]
MLINFFQRNQKNKLQSFMYIKNREKKIKLIIDKENTEQIRKRMIEIKKTLLFLLYFLINCCQCQDQFPIKLMNNTYVQYIKEFNSIIYTNYTGFTIFSTLDKQGKIQNSYKLNNYQTNNPKGQACFINETKIYLTDSNLAYYYIIDFDKIGSGNISDYLFQKNYPSLTYACDRYLITKIGSIFYNLCFSPLNPKNSFIISAPTFDNLFTSTNILYNNQSTFSNNLSYQDNEYQFIVMGNRIFMDDGNYYYLNQNQTFKILSRKNNLCLLGDQTLCKMQFQGNQLMIAQSQYNINSQSRLIELQNKPFIVAYYNSQFTIFDVEKLQIAKTQGAPLIQTKFFQYQNFLFFQNYYQELQYNQSNDTTVIIQQSLIQNIQQFNIPAPLFSYGFTFNLQSGCYAPLSHKCFSYLNSIQKLYQMIPGCQQYSDNQLSSCLQCNPQYFMQNGICVTNCQQGYFQDGVNCFPCYQNCQSCNGLLFTDCLTCKKDLYQFQDNSCGICNNATNAYLISGNKCECQNGFTYFNSTCIQKQDPAQQQQQSYQSEIFTQSKVQQFTQQSQVSSQVTFATTTILSSIQNFFSSTNFGVVINGLTCLKLSYLTLVDTNLPHQVYNPLSVIINQCPTQSFKNLNAFLLIGEEDLNIYFNAKYQNIGLSYIILHTSGSAFFLLLICCCFIALFYYLLEINKNEKILEISQLVYQKLFCGFIIQYIQLVMAIFVLGINLQIKQFFFDLDKRTIGIYLTLIIFVFLPLTVLIFLKMYQLLNKFENPQKEVNFLQITKEKIQNETISESRIRKNFILIYLSFESIIIPTIFIQFSQSWIALGVLSIIFQLSYVIIVIYLRPFYSKLTNSYFIIDSLLWLFQYIQYFILSSYSSKSNMNNYVKIIDSVSYSFLINLQFILLYLTVHMIIELLVKLYEYFKQKLMQKDTKEQSNKIDINLISEQHSSNNKLIINNTIQMVKIGEQKLEILQINESTDEKNLKIQIQEQLQVQKEIQSV